MKLVLALLAVAGVANGVSELVFKSAKHGTCKVTHDAKGEVRTDCELFTGNHAVSVQDQLNYLTSRVSTLEAACPRSRSR